MTFTKLTNGEFAVIGAISYCQCHELFSATDLKDVLEHLENQDSLPEVPVAIPIKLVTKPEVAAVITQKRSINEYTCMGGGLM